jgi:hypothetical protein
MGQANRLVVGDKLSTRVAVVLGEAIALSPLFQPGAIAQREICIERVQFQGRTIRTMIAVPP